MSSLVRTIQKRIWKRQGRAAFSHDGAHGGFKSVTIPGTDHTIQVNRCAWPLTSAGFVETEE